MTSYKIYGEHNKPTPSAIGAAQSMASTYPGKGRYGQSNPTTLTFDFAPKLVFINATFARGSSQCYAWGHFTANGKVAFYNERRSDGIDEFVPLNVTWSEDGRTLSWYAESDGPGAAMAQFDWSGVTYNYVAIG